MTKILLSLTALCLMIVPVSGQTSLLPEDGFEVATWLPEYPNVGAFDISDTLIYLSDGDTIHMLDMNSGSEVKNFGLPEDYSSTHYVSFLSVSPEGNSIWTGYTSTGNLDDRIYSVDVETGQWEFQATFPGNMDLVFWKDSILVSGLNNASWDAPASIFVLDTSGANQHRRIIEPGGYSAGMAIDEQDNLYYGTSYGSDPNALYRWDYSLIQPLIEIPGKIILNTDHGEKLTDLPAGAYDCEVDEGGHVLFNMNLYGGTMAVCMWSGTPGDGYHIDTLATARGEWDWLGILKSKGDITIAEPGNMVVTYSFGQPLAILTRKNTVGIKGDLAKQISVYPNPSSGNFFIGFEGTHQMDLHVYSMQGSLVYKKTDILPGAAIDLTGQPAGNYMIRVTGGQELMVKMIQKL
jgi:hypothetical protein